MNWAVVGIVLTIVVTVAGWGVTFGVCKNQINENAKDIEEVKRQHLADMKELKDQQKSDVAMLIQKQTNTDNLLQTITNQLVELNTKVSLLIKGKIVTE
mgnify:CR=1 FL=1